MSRIITRTLWGADLQERLLLGIPYQLTPFTTLNEKFNVQAGVMPNTGETPRLQYFCIGNGGHANITGTDGKPLTAPIQHSPGDAALYAHMPFLIRDPANDLDVTTRQNYGLRKLVVGPDGNNWIAYYLKRLNLNGVVPALNQNHVDNGVTTTTPYVPTSANLNPQAPDISSTGVVTTSGDYLSTSAILNLNFDANDVAEYTNVAKTWYGSDLYAVISEIGLVSGSDKIVTSDTTPQFNYNEVVCAQIDTFITAYYPMGFSNQGFDFGIELGATEPLIGATNVTSGP